tara:strand:- start:3677 stop:4672 length:996 start_codon:yes stop_codon:yes gene_type:complete
MLRALIIIVVIIGGLIGLSMVASRGGHETYDAQYFTPGPVIGLLKGLSDDETQGRGIGTPGAERARDMIEARMSALEMLTLGNSYRHGFTVEADEAFSDEISAGDTVQGVNLIGVVQGSSGSDQLIIVTAHYDHMGLQDGEIFNGADDNASGVAAAMAMAQHFSRTRKQPEHTMLFAFVDGEEHGLLGARAFVETTTLPRSSLAFNLNLDMMARADTGTLWASGPHHTPALIPLIEEVSAEAPIDFQIGFDGTDPEQQDWTELSDHGAFYEAGIPHLYIGVDYHADYHRPTDDFENIDQNVFLAAVDTAIMVAQRIDAQLDELTTPVAQAQ